MDLAAAKAIGAGIAAIALGGAGIGIGHIFGNYLAGALRNPAAAAGQRGTLFLGFAFAEATGLIGFAVAMLILFGGSTHPRFAGGCRRRTVTGAEHAAT